MRRRRARHGGASGQAGVPPDLGVRSAAGGRLATAKYDGGAYDLWIFKDGIFQHLGDGWYENVGARLLPRAMIRICDVYDSSIPGGLLRMRLA